MYKSLNNQTNEEIIILDPCWNEETIAPLRKRGREGFLCCPVCKQQVHVKAGNKKRWHFAHKDLSNCPLKHESPKILVARSLLYSWLQSKYGDKVTIEKFFPDKNLPRPLDCYVEISGDLKIGYCILERGIRDRHSLRNIFAGLDISIVWILLTDMLKIDSETLNAVHLSPTERDFIYSSEYSQLYSHYDTSLSYLDVDDQTVKTLRGLHCIHLPQKYTFESRLKNNLTQMLFSPKTGELVHPNEHERLTELIQQRLKQARLKEIEEHKRREEIQKRQKEINQQQKRLSKQLSVQKPVKHLNTATQVSPKCPTREPQKQVSSSYLDRPYPCRVCDTMTTNWTTLDLANNTCICSRECLKALHDQK